MTLFIGSDYKAYVMRIYNMTLFIGSDYKALNEDIHHDVI